MNVSFLVLISILFVFPGGLRVLIISLVIISISPIITLSSSIHPSPLRTYDSSTGKVFISVEFHTNKKGPGITLALLSRTNMGSLHRIRTYTSARHKAQCYRYTRRERYLNGTWTHTATGKCWKKPVECSPLHHEIFQVDRTFPLAFNHKWTLQRLGSLLSQFPRRCPVLWEHLRIYGFTFGL